MPELCRMPVSLVLFLPGLKVKLNEERETVEIEKAKIKDVEAIYSLINYYAKQGKMLPKSLTFIYENLRQYHVVREEGKVIGVGALRIFWFDLAEVCSLAVDKDYLNLGLGSKILSQLENEASQLGLSQVFALTYQEEFFTKNGYCRVERGSLPQKIWADCICCKKFQNCDEIAMVKNLTD